MSIHSLLFDAINDLDVRTVQAVNAMAGHMPLFDILVLRVFRLDSIRHLPLVAALIWAWCTDPGDGTRRRPVFDGVVGYMISIFVTRLAQGMMPHRPRPALDGTFHFELPVGGFTSDWSSFPSDTAAQGFALVAAIWMLSRKLGIGALLWTIVVICFPRLYGGFHYPSDLVVGGVVGILATWVVSMRPLGLDRVEHVVVRAEHDYRPWFYIFGFFILFQIMMHLEDAREVLRIMGTMKAQLFGA